MYLASVAADRSHPIGRSNAPHSEESGIGFLGRRPRRRWPILVLAVAALFFMLFAWVAITAPLSKSLQPPVAAGLTLLSKEGRPIAREGAIVDAPVSVEQLPARVWLPVLAIEDRRFYEHWGVDPRGLTRAAWRNLRAGGIREGGSTITQQLAKHAFLDADRSVGRKLREIVIAYWLEAQLSKDEILSRYLSTAYFGDNVYGLRAAAHHYFDRPPERLTLSQSAMLAGLLKAPSRLNPVADLEASQARARTVLAAMADAGLIDRDEAARLPAAVPVRVAAREVPSGTYFADWTFPAARRTAEITGERSLRTTLEYGLQQLAWRTIARNRLHGAQVALVAMRPDGSVAAMVGGRNYRESPFNRVTQARRPPGSTFKLFVYLAALRAGYTPDTPIEDLPVTIADWSPANADGQYRGIINLRTAFGESSNVAAVRLAQQVGMQRVVDAARDLGVRSPLDPSPSLALGTSDMTLLELTGAYAAALSGTYPVTPSGLAPELRGATGQPAPSRLDRQSTWPMLLDFLWASANLGTGRSAALDIPTFGKTGTSQDHRDAVFVGFAGDLVVGVWVGHDDNRPLRGVYGGGLPARIWHDFMIGAQRSGAIRTGTDSPFQVPNIRYVPSAVPDPRPLVRTARAPQPMSQRSEPEFAAREGRRTDARWQRWLREHEAWERRQREWDRRWGRRGRVREDR